MKNLVRAIAAASALMLVPAAGNATAFTLSGLMDPFQALTNSANSGNGSGQISGTYDDVTNLLSYNISWANLSGTVTNMHFHFPPPGSSGGVSLGIPGPWASPEIGTNIALDGAQETDLLAGNWYVNIHTAQFGGGEIRGQVTAEAVPVPATLGLLGLSIAGLGVIARRRKSA